MLRALLVLAFVGPIFISGGRQTTGTPPADTFVTLAESTTFGPGGSIFDYSTRIVAPKYIGPPPAHTDPIYLPANTLDLSASTCSATTGSGATLHSVLQNTIESHLSLAGGRKNSVILLPTGCAVNWYVTAAGSGAEFTIPNTTDNLQFYCPPGNTVCGINQVIRTDSVAVGNMHPDGYLSGSSAGEHRTRSFHVGDSRRTGITTCDITPTDEYCARVYQLTCSLAISGASAWGPGDIVRIQSDPIPGQGTDGYNYLTRVTCVEDSSGVRSPASDTSGELCGLLGAPGTNRVQVENPPPFNLHPDANWWGENDGTTFTNCTNSSSCTATNFTDTYRPTAWIPGSPGSQGNPEMVQIERMGSSRCDIVATGVCGNGTASTGTAEVIAENVWFVNLNWTMDLKIGGAVMRFLNAYGGGIYGGKFTGTAAPSAVEFGGTGAEAGSITVAGMTWENFWVENAKASGKILQVNKTNPVTIHVAGLSAHTIWASTGDTRLHITDGIGEPLFKDKQFVSTSGTFTAGTPGYWVVRLDNVDGTVSGFDIDTTVGTGWASRFDQFGGGTMYANGFASNVQIYNNVFINPEQHMIMQGCTGCVYAANYLRNPPDESGQSRGPFHHGNAGSPGNIYEMNDQDSSIVTMDTSNRAPDDAGEGSNLVFYKNRRPSRGATTAPIGGSVFPDYGHSAVLGGQRGANQKGAANENWSIFLNAGHGAVINGTGTRGLTGCDNTDTSPYNCLAPHQTVNNAVFRNKCGSCDLDGLIDGVDSNADGIPDTRNTTTRTDILLTEDGENHLGLEVNWAAEVGEEPTSIFWREKPEWWCNEAMDFGEMGAYYDNFSGTLGKLPAQIRYEGTTCTLP
jgi:hypothetical protein